MFRVVEIFSPVQQRKFSKSHKHTHESMAASSLCAGMLGENVKMVVMIHEKIIMMINIIAIKHYFRKENLCKR